MVFVAHLKNKMRFTSRKCKFKIPLNCTLPQYGIYKKQNTGTKLNKSIYIFPMIQSFQNEVRAPYSGLSWLFVTLLRDFDIAGKFQEICKEQYSCLKISK
jgi:hypothetical protein